MDTVRSLYCIYYRRDEYEDLSFLLFILTVLHMGPWIL